MSGGADVGEEALHVTAERLGLLRERGRRAQDLARGGAGLVRRLGDPGDVVGDLCRTFGGLLDVARDLVSGGALLLHGRGDGAGDLVDLRYRAADRLDCRYGLAGGALDLRDLARDLL